ncbi:hypothetical protein ACVWW4_000857 [Bradyrhizobium sp. LB7.1]
MNAVTPLPVEIDPRPCELCGLTIDRHQMIDEGEGPEFFCIDVPVDELTLDELERRDELRRLEACAAMVRDWEMEDPRDSWRWTGAPRPGAPDHTEAGPRAPRAGSQHHCGVPQRRAARSTGQVVKVDR